VVSAIIAKILRMSNKTEKWREQEREREREREKESGTIALF